MNDDDNALKEAERRDWSARGPAWAKWAEPLAKLAERMNLPLVEAAMLEPGLTVLDLASGAGEPAVQIARAVGPSGRVVATDLADPMLEGARRRAATEGLKQLTVEVADMEALPFPDASFDRVTCRFGIMFAPDTAKALSESKRVLKPGGRAAYLVWSLLERNSIFRAIDGAARDLLNGSLLDRPTHPFRFADGSLAIRMVEAGLAVVEDRTIAYAPEIEAGQPFWRPQVEMMLADRLSALDKGARAAFEAKVEANFSPYLKDGKYRLSAETRLVVGRRP